MTPVRYGLIGFGGIAERRIAPEGFAHDQRRFPKLDEAGLVAVTSRSDRRRSAAEAMGLSWQESVDELLGREDIQAVFVASNNLSHFEHAARALRAGKHVIVDKPLTTNREQAEELIRLAREAGLSLGVNHMMVHNSLNRKAREQIRSRGMGELQEISLHMEFEYGNAPEEAATWRCSVPEERGGPIGDVGSHCLYMAEFLTESRVRRVGCTYAPRTLEIAVESGADIRFETETGVWGRVRVGFDVRRRGLEATVLGMGYEIYGSEGVVRGLGTLGQFSGHPDEPVAIRLELDNFRENRRLLADSTTNMYTEVVRKQGLSIQRAEPLTGEDALRNLDLLLAAYNSAEQGGIMVDVR